MDLGERNDRDPEAAGKVRCDCGTWLEVADRDGYVTCECGNSFVVTITEMW